MLAFIGLTLIVSGLFSFAVTHPLVGIAMIMIGGCCLLAYLDGCGGRGGGSYRGSGGSSSGSYDNCGGWDD